MDDPNSSDESTELVVIGYQSEKEPNMEGTVELLERNIEDEQSCIYHIMEIKTLLENNEIYVSEKEIQDSLVMLTYIVCSIEHLRATYIGPTVRDLQNHWSKMVKEHATMVIEYFKKLIVERVDLDAQLAREQDPTPLANGEVLYNLPMDERSPMSIIPPSELDTYFDDLDDDGNLKILIPETKELQEGQSNLMDRGERLSSITAILRKKEQLIQDLIYNNHKDKKEHLQMLEKKRKLVRKELPAAVRTTNRRHKRTRLRRPSDTQDALCRFGQRRQQVGAIENHHVIANNNVRKGKDINVVENHYALLKNIEKQKEDDVFVNQVKNIEKLKGVDIVENRMKNIKKKNEVGVEIRMKNKNIEKEKEDDVFDNSAENIKKEKKFNVENPLKNFKQYKKFEVGNLVKNFKNGMKIDDGSHLKNFKQDKKTDFVNPLKEMKKDMEIDVEFPLKNLIKDRKFEGQSQRKEKLQIGGENQRNDIKRKEKRIDDANHVVGIKRHKEIDEQNHMMQIKRHKKMDVENHVSEIKRRRDNQLGVENHVSDIRKEKKINDGNHVKNIERREKQREFEKKVKKLDAKNQRNFINKIKHEADESSNAAHRHPSRSSNGGVDLDEKFEASKKKLLQSLKDHERDRRKTEFIPENPNGECRRSSSGRRYSYQN